MIFMQYETDSEITGILILKTAIMFSSGEHGAFAMVATIPIAPGTPMGHWETIRNESKK